MLGTLKFGVSTPTLKNEKRKIDEKLIIDKFLATYKNHFVGTGQEFFMNVEATDLVLKVSEHEFIDGKTTMHYGMCFEETNLEFKSKSMDLKIASASMKEKNIFSQKFKFEDIGVGGMDKEITEIFRRVFATRRLPPSVLAKYGKSHVKGVLLYGPPGTGKTLIAKELAKCLNSVKPLIVNGPEILSKFVGESEENVRKLFAPAKKDQMELGDDSPLHVIIFDEFDAIAKPRGMESDGTGVASNVVNQLLSMIDGVESLNNILIVGMTNRKDLIDPAILRPGRFEVHLEIGLPNEEGRVQIFKIHTKEMLANGILGQDVDLNKLAAETKNYTGSEIEKVVKCAISYSMNRNHDLMNFSKQLNFTKESMIVGMNDFLQALEEITPEFGFDEDKIESRLRGDIITYGPQFDSLIVNLKNSIMGFAQSDIPLASMLLYGKQGAGKTTLACKLAKLSQIPYVKLVSSEEVIGLTEYGKIKVVRELFINAYKSQVSLIILDEIERLLEYVSLGHRFSNNMLQCLLTYLKKLPEKIGHKIIVIGTTSNTEVLKELGVWDCFNLKCDVPLVKGKDITSALQQLVPNNDRAINSIPIERSYQIPIKNLYFIANVINQKLSQDPNIDISTIFLEMTSQIAID